MDKTSKYDLVLSWGEWLKSKPLLKILLVNCRSKNWGPAVSVFKNVEKASKNRRRETCSSVQTSIFHGIFYTIEGLEELDTFTNFIWNKCDDGAISMMQLLGHRYRDEGNFVKMNECYLKSALRSEKFGDLKWGVSAYFYLASYAEDHEQAEWHICTLLEKYASIVPVGWKRDLHKHKIHRPAVWLACHAKSARGKALLKRLPKHLPLPASERIEFLIEHYAQIKKDQDCFLGRNGKVVQGPNDLDQNQHDPMWGWLNWFNAKI